ncbi:MAG TPA: invasion associated locus B family protein [Magnetospirillaceae bacterium]|jgi:hypothetical protein
MMIRRFAPLVLGTAALGLLLGLTLPLMAADTAPKSLGKFGEWEAFAKTGPDGKVCYAASLPKQSKNAPKTRERAYTLVSNRPSDKSHNVIGITAGFALKKGASALLQVSGNRFDLYTVDQTAWSRDDKAVVAALTKAKTATFVGYPAKGEPVADVYGLEGFGDAKAAIDKACGGK